MPKRSSRRAVVEKQPLLHSTAQTQTPRPAVMAQQPPVIRVTPATSTHHSAGCSTAAVLPAVATSSCSSSMKYDMMQHDNSLTAKEIYRLSCDDQINIADPSWTEKLHWAILANDLELCEAFLCCGVPMTAGLLDTVPEQYEEVKSLCGKFYPDMWSSVRAGNVKQVRCLVNLWHKVSLMRDGKPLFQLAIEHANPYIISLIGGIQTTMDVAHLVLAGHTEKLKASRSSGPFIRRTLKHFGRNCAPILYFAMVQNDPVLVIELCEHFGLKSDDEMLDQDGLEIPLLFAALQAALDVRIIACFMQHTNRDLGNLWYHRRNILQYALDLQVSPDIFAVLLEYGGGRLVGERDATNRALMDLIIEREDANDPLNASYRLALERRIKMWIADCSIDAVWLTVMGVEFPPSSVELAAGTFMEELVGIRERIAGMDECVENNDVQWLEELLQLEGAVEKWPNTAWHGHPTGSGQTLLHRAVILNRPAIVELLLTQADMSSVPLDAFGASPLHYACAASEYDTVERALLCAGFGEHYMDKADHDCASYRIKRDTPEMLQYLAVLAAGDCAGAADVDPWTVAQPLDGGGGCSTGEDGLEDLPYLKRILTPPDRDGTGGRRLSSSRKGSTHSQGKRSMGAQPDSWCLLS